MHAAADAIQLANEPQEEVACPLCGEDRPELVLVARDRLFGRPGDYRIVRCQACDMRYVSPRPTLQALGAHYPNDYFIYTPPEELPILFRHWARAVSQYRWRSYLRRFERVRGRFGPETKVVDVGCGLNDHLQVLKQVRGTQGIGVDFKPEVVAYVRERLGMPIEQGTLVQAQFPTGAFDVVTMNEYLEHEPDPRGVLTEARRVTKKGGHLAVEIPFTEGFPAKLFGARWSQVDAPRHLVHFTRKTLADMLQRCGYRLVHTETFHLPAFIGVSVLQVLGHTRVGRLGVIETSLAVLASLPFMLAFPFIDEFMFAVAEAE